MRQTRLLARGNWDDPNDICNAGSNEEFDMLCEWSRDELVELIQQLDKQLYKAEQKIEKLDQYKSMYEGLCK